MTDIYLTDKIIINQGKYYYENENNKDRKLINNKNWHRILLDTGWHKLDKTWIMRLNTFATGSGNSKWGLLDCDNNGDCFYSVVAEAFNYYYKNIEKDDLMDVIDIRKKIGYVVSPHDLKEIPNIIRNLNKTDNIFNEQIKESRSKIVYNVGESSKVGAKYIHKLSTWR